ncbi:MAG TPA: diadenylate cyclase CdaA [Tepidisphaeraceae bacterium]
MFEALNLHNFFTAIRTYGWWSVITEWVIIGAVIFWILRFLRGTRGARMLKGIAVILISTYLIVSLVADKLGLDRIAFLYDRLLYVATLAIVVVFQPELRRALMRIGETRLFHSYSTQLGDEIDAIVTAVSHLSRRKFGALIALEREVGLGGIADTGTRLDAELTPELLETIFFPNTPLHDLGVIISQGKVAYASVQFPLADAEESEKELGSRHRAAMGLSQESDAVVVVVSEETGDISIAESGKLIRKLTLDGLRGLLGELLGAPDIDEQEDAVERNSTFESPAAADDIVAEKKFESEKSVKV